MALTPQDIDRIAHLARLELSAPEQERMLAQINGFFDIVEQMRAVDTADVQVRSETQFLPAQAAVSQHHEAPARRLSRHDRAVGRDDTGDPGAVVYDALAAAHGRAVADERAPRAREPVGRLPGPGARDRSKCPCCDYWRLPFSNCITRAERRPVRGPAGLSRQSVRFVVRS